MKVRDTVKALMRQGRGILAADESERTISERFAVHGIPSTPDTRRAYRELLVATPGAEEYLSGVILHDETIRQSLADGMPFPEFLFSKNILTGIKVDLGMKDDPQFEGAVTEGLEGLPVRLAEYVRLGASFTKWRAAFPVSISPSAAHLRENASRLAAFARESLAAGCVPLVEPEVLMDGAHAAEDAERTLMEVLAVVVDALAAQNVPLDSIIIKTAMAVAGSDADARTAPGEVAERTVRALTSALPEEIGGIAFLSGGQSPEEATLNLNAIAHLEPLPWDITFSFARALQSPVMERWQGHDDMRDEAQSIFLQRLALAVQADAGGYDSRAEESSLSHI